MKSTPSKGMKRRLGDGRAAFISHIDALQKWVDSGRTLRAFYDDHESALGISYSQFARYAGDFIRPLLIPNRSRNNAKPPTARDHIDAKPSAPRGTPTTQVSTKPKFFNHSADAADLI